MQIKYSLHKLLYFSVIGLEGTHQRYNASLALQLCRFWLLEKENFGMELNETLEIFLFVVLVVYHIYNF